MIRIIQKILVALLIWSITKVVSLRVSSVVNYGPLSAWNIWNLPLLFQGLEILEKQYFFCLGCLKILEFVFENDAISYRIS